MNPYALPSLICLLTIPFCGAFIYSQNRHSTVHRLFLAITAWIAYWAFIEFNIIQSPTYNEAVFWTRAGFLRTVVTSIFLHFVLEYIGKWKQLDRGKAVLLLYTAPLIISGYDLVTAGFFGLPIKKYYGWVSGAPALPLINALYSVWTVGAIAFVFQHVWKYYKNASPYQKHAARIFFTTFACTTLASIAAFLVSSLFVPHFPDVTIPMAFISILIITYSIWKYRLFITPAEAAEEIIDILADGMLLLDSNREIVRINRAITSLTGYDEREIVGERPTIILENVPEHHHPPVFQFETNLKTKDQKAIPVLVSVSSMYDRSGATSGTVLLIKDLTYFKKTQMELSKAERLATLELLTGGFAHDFNNLLTTISVYTSMVEGVQYSPEMIKANMATAGKAALVAGNLTRQLATFWKDHKPEKQLCMVQDIITECIELTFRATPIKREITCSSDLPPIEADKYQLMQVFINLFINARQAMNQQGTIRVSCETCVLSDEPFGKTAPKSPFIKIDVADTGCGIPETNLKRIFDPYFTTKEKGTGLGLSIVRNIIREHGGGINVKSKPGEGAQFTVFLPALTEEPIPEPPPGAQTISPAKKRILIMDPDQMVRAAIAGMLGHMGHDVVYTADMSEAIETFLRDQAENKPFDVVMLDIGITQVKGAHHTLKRILEIKPDTRAILASSIKSHPVVQHFKEYGFNSFISKPFSRDELLSALTKSFTPDAGTPVDT